MGSKRGSKASGWCLKDTEGCAERLSSHLHWVFACSAGIHLSLGAGVLGDGLGALRHGVLGKLTGKDEANGGLDLAGRHGGLLVVAAQTASLTGGLLKDVVDERVHDGHSAAGDAGVGVHLLEHDVAFECFVSESP